MRAGYETGGGPAGDRDLVKVDSALRGSPVRWEGGQAHVFQTPGCWEQPLTVLYPQVPTPVSTKASASTPWAPSSASVCRATPVLAVRSMSTNASQTRVRTTPPAWTRLGSSSASACPVRGACLTGNRVRPDRPWEHPQPPRPSGHSLRQHLGKPREPGLEGMAGSGDRVGGWAAGIRCRGCRQYAVDGWGWASLSVPRASPAGLWRGRQDHAWH